MDIQPTTTLDTYKGLVSAGFSEDQAEAVVRSVNSSNLNLATKEELSNEIMGVKGEIGLLRKDMEAMGTELRSEIRDVRKDMEIMGSDIRKDMRAMNDELRVELKGDIAALANDMNTKFNTLVITLTGLIICVVGLIISIKL